MAENNSGANMEGERILSQRNQLFNRQFFYQIQKGNFNFTFTDAVTVIYLNQFLNVVYVFFCLNNNKLENVWFFLNNNNKREQ